MEAKPKPVGTTNVTNSNLSNYTPFHIAFEQKSDDVHAVNNCSRLNGIRIRSNDGECRQREWTIFSFIDPSNRKG